MIATERVEKARQRIEERQEAARKATQGRWKLWGMEVRADPVGDSNLDTSLPVARTFHETGLFTFNANHIRINDPAHALAVLDGHLGVLDRHTLVRQATVGGSTDACAICGAGQAAHWAYAPDMWPCPEIKWLLDLYASEAL